MKKITAIIMAVAAVISIASAAIAKDVVIEKKITAMAEKTDKNGNPYIRMSFETMNELGGITYPTTSSIMIFSDKVGLVKALGLKPGSSIKAVCSENEYKGRMGYVLVAFDPSMAKSVTPAVQVAPVIQAAPAATNTQAFSSPSSISVR